MKDTDFYDKESSTYSDKRYPKKPATYAQFFFTERLKETLDILARHIGTRRNISFLDIGCADGFVLERIYNRFPDSFSRIVGIDVSPEMISAARKAYSAAPFIFSLRKDFVVKDLEYLIVETGVINYADFSEEVDFAHRLLKDNGLYLISLAGTDSLWNKIKKEGAGFRNFLSYEEYEKGIKERFDILETVPVGLFIPLAWKIPALGRAVTAVCETILRPIAPNLFHEKTYLLRKK